MRVYNSTNIALISAKPEIAPLIERVNTDKKEVEIK